MLPNFVRRPSASGAACCFTLVTLVVGCGEAVQTPFFEEPQPAAAGTGRGGRNQGGASGIGSGGSLVGGGAGISTGGMTGGASSGEGGTAAASGTSAEGGTGPTGGTGSGGMAGSGMGGISGAGGAGGSGGAPVDCSSADPAAVSFEGHCYVFRATAVTWEDALDDCDEDGAHLVTIDSMGRTEAEFLAENAFVWTLGGSQELWIGATDGRQSDEPGNGTPYSWITNAPIVYDRWSSGQPNNALSACMEDAPCSCGDMCWEHCAFMWDQDAAATWNDRHCEHLVAYVCEWDEPPM